MTWRWRCGTEFMASGPMLDVGRVEAKLTDRIGALEASRAQLALAEKTRAQNQLLLKQNFISQTAYDSAESNLSVTQGTLKSIEAQAQLAKNALRDAVVAAPLSGTVAKRHVQPGEKVNFDAPLVTIVDLAEMELQAMVPANDMPGAGSRHESGTGDRRLRRSPLYGHGRSHQPDDRSRYPGDPGVHPHPEPRCGAARRYVRHGRVTLAAGAPVPTLPAVAIHSEAGQNFIWTIENGKLARRIVTVGRRDDTAGRAEIKNALPPASRYWRRRSTT